MRSLDKKWHFGKTTSTYETVCNAVIRCSIKFNILSSFGAKFDEIAIFQIVCCLTLRGQRTVLSNCQVM